jgi:hypothetical protein
MPHIQEEKVTIPDGSNAITVDVTNHSFVSILRNGREVVTDRGETGSYRFILSRGDYVVRTDGKLGQVTASMAELPGIGLRDFLQPGARTGRLRVSAAAPFVHPVDRVGQLPADGKSAATVTVQCVDGDGKVLADAGHVLYLRATGGSLVSETGAPTSQVRLKGGQASFRIVADAVPRFLTITVFGASPGLRAELPFEFVPPSELAGRPSAT